jgi:hypothetical protein
VIACVHQHKVEVIVGLFHFTPHSPKGEADLMSLREIKEKERSLIFGRSILLHNILVQQNLSGLEDLTGLNHL